MKIVFVSNFYNHHQAPFALAMDRLTDHEFYFIETEPLSKERAQMGWGESEVPSFVLQSYENAHVAERCKALIMEADAVIWGSCPMAMIRPRLRQRKLTFAYSERLFKKGMRGLEFWGRAVKHYCRHRLYQKNHYLLCASAYAAADYAKLGLFRGKAFQWGYFPAVKEYEDIDAVISQKAENSFLWVGRLIGWKHPEYAVEVAKKLQEKGVIFHLNIIGTGIKEDEIRDLICKYHLEDVVHLLGAMKPKAVIKQMGASRVFLFTSDQNEGWGAVLNESMNSGCAVIASDQAGSVPYLLQDGKNGLIFSNGNIDQLVEQVEKVLADDSYRRELGRNAYQTMCSTWNAQAAAERLVQFIGDQTVSFPEGPMHLEE